MKKIIGIGILFLSLLVMTACGGGDNKSSGDSNSGSSSNNGETITLKAAVAYSSSSAQTQFVEWLADEVEEKSDGRLKIDIFPEAQLMPGNQEIPAMLEGQIDMNHASSGVATSFEPSWYVFDMPYIFKFDNTDPSVYVNNKRAFLNMENGGKLIEKKMEERGIKVIAHTMTGFQYGFFTSSTDNKITDVDSIDGLKIRINGGTYVPEMLQNVGASGMNITGAELTPALQQGVIDGLITDVLYAYDAKLPVKTLTPMPVANHSNAILMSLEKFNSLPEDLQQILVDAGKALEAYSDEYSIDRGKTAFEDFEKEGVEVYLPTQDELDDWEKDLTPIWDEFVKNVDDGDKLIEAVKENLE
ncbi:TRAP transporter substrate-binding protein [Caldifermentibacillus hisashii]|jgi:TRAP-type C4-dicarboxylate transport system substrate-binding protein|uniref:TRAP transporter substrate-binding protein n=1 Tax=Caldifermentibacillus hisashii TaxID=996558 RepID=UPI0031FC4857